jgi:hypothetical protein
MSSIGGELLFHHCRDLTHVEFGVVRQARVSNILPRPERAPSDRLERNHWFEEKFDWEPAYDWLGQQVGFYPLFLAVGSTDDDRRMTGYQDQWRRLLGHGTEDKVYRRRGEAPSRCLFSWAHMPQDIVFLDYGYWHVVLNSVVPNPRQYECDQPRVELPRWFDERSLFRRSWRASDWLRRARLSGGIQAIAPSLDLSTADEVWCRNLEARERLVSLGFAEARIRVHRLTMNETRRARRRV